MMIGHATARAHANIALVKYWGKRDERLNLPTNGSLSLTLDGLYTTTRVAFDTSLAEDIFVLNGEVQSGEAARRVSKFLDIVRGDADLLSPARVDSTNHVPTAAGLASSASAFAALAAAASRAARVSHDPETLSRLAREGSGSACRSIYGGFVEWRKGEREDGSDSHGVPIAPVEHWNLRMLVAVLTRKAKGVSSRDGMRATVATSPLYPGWLASVEADLAAMRLAVKERDFEALGTVAEANALRMHATMLGARPPLLYWQPATVAILHEVWALRAKGIPAYATIDAGPNVKVLCEREHEIAVRAALEALPEVESLIACGPGPGVEWLDAEARS